MSKVQEWLDKHPFIHTLPSPDSV